MQRATRSVKPVCRSNWANSKRPPSEERLPPEKSTCSALRERRGKSRGVLESGIGGCFLSVRAIGRLTNRTPGKRNILPYFGTGRRTPRGRFEHVVNNPG